MALVATINAINRIQPELNTSVGNKPMRELVGTFAMDNSYATGGLAWDLSSYFPGGLENVFPFAWGGYSFEYDKANKKMKAMRGDNANASPAPAVEVSAAVNLSALTAIPFIARGYVN